MKRTIALPLLLLPLAGCGSSSTADQAGEPSVLVSVGKPTRGSLPQSVEAFGSATPATNGAETISMAQPGQVTSLAVTPGASVRAGQTLATFTVAPTARSTYLRSLLRRSSATAPPSCSRSNWRPGTSWCRPKRPCPTRA